MVTLAQSSPGDRSARAPQSKTATVMLGVGNADPAELEQDAVVPVERNAEVVDAFRQRGQLGETTCNARPDHTLGQNAKYSERADNFRFAPHERTSSSTNAMSEKYHQRKSPTLPRSLATTSAP